MYNMKVIVIVFSTPKQTRSCVITLRFLWGNVLFFLFIDILTHSQAHMVQKIAASVADQC